jgi:mono/diheme cytochrome c family protein
MFHGIHPVCKNTFTLIYSSDQIGHPEDLVQASRFTQWRKFAGSAAARAGGILFFLAPALLGQDGGFHHAPSSAAARKNPLAGQHAAVAAGKTIYASKCSKCHGEQGRGTGPIPPLAKGRAQRARVGELFWFITEGDIDSGLPSWKSLSDRQRWQVVTYIKSLGTPDRSRAKDRQ